MELAIEPDAADKLPNKKSRKVLELKSCNRLMSCLWMAQNYAVVKGTLTSLGAIMAMYQSVKENVSFQLNQWIVADLVKELFGEEVVAFRPRGSDGKQRLAFRNLGLNTNSEISAEKRNQWIERGRDGLDMNFVKFTGYKVNGFDHSLLLTVKNDLSFSLTGTSGSFTTIVQNDCAFDSPESPISVDLILFYTASLRPCLGFPKTSHHCTVLRNQKDEAITEIDVEGEPRLISKVCELIATKKGALCGACCDAQKCLSRRKAELKNIKFTRNSVLSKEELCLKLETLNRDKRNAERREAYWKAKFAEECMEVDSDDHHDFTQMLDGVEAEKVNDDMRLLLQQQQKALQTHSKHGHRWHPKIIKLCLELYVTSPKAFDMLKQHLILPSKRLVRYYKNAIPPSSGWNPEVFKWLLREAKRLKLKEEDKWSGLIFDEMTIQEDLEFVKVGGKCKLVGAVALGSTYEDLKVLTTGKQDVELAKKVMQFAVVTDSGFRFALAHFPVNSMPAAILLEKFWEGVKWCRRAGFRIYWTLCDGGEPNRSFIKMLFPPGTEPEDSNFVAYNVHTGGELVVMLDCKHNFKKIRNNLEKSNSNPNSTRKLINNGKAIMFQHWKDAFSWDQQAHSLKIHEKLTEAHFELNPKSKMRNQLAEDVLDKKMLNLMKEYKNHLLEQSKQQKAESLDETINLLGYTSELIDLFHSKVPLSDMFDQRILKGKEFMKYLEDWKVNAATAKNFLSDKLWFDLRAMLVGLEQVVRIKTTKFQGAAIKPVLVNQDILENIFCQIRGCNGQNNHPKYHLYMTTITTVNIGQTVISKKGNTGGNKDALPSSGLPLEHPFKKAKLC